MSTTEGAVPSSTTRSEAVASAPPPPNPYLKAIRNKLFLQLQKSDSDIVRLSKVFSTPAGTDNLLLTVGYTSLLTSTILSSISLLRLQKAVGLIIEKAILLPPNITVLIDAFSIPASHLLISAKRLRALSDLISDYRIFVRLWSLFDIYRWGKRILLTPSPDNFLQRLVCAQVFVNLILEALENGAYLSSKGIIGWSAQTQKRAYIWSSRFWMAHVGLDIWRLRHELEKRRDRGTAEEKRTDGPKGDVITDAGEREWMAKWTKELVVNLGYAPLTLHWSLETGLISDFWVGLFGSVVGIAGLRARWQDTLAD
jgi:hypothetical protein